MINKDYILRIAERLGRALAVILQLRKVNKHEEALIYIDELMLRTVGLTSRFINSISEEMLLQTISPLGNLNVNACLWIATLLKAEGEIYEDQGNANESYYRYVKSLELFLTVLLHESIPPDSNFYEETAELLHKLKDYELPVSTQSKLIAYYEHIGQYGKAEDILFELLESNTDQAARDKLFEQGEAFYTRLLSKKAADLQQGNFTREEVEEGMAHLHSLKG